MKYLARFDAEGLPLGFYPDDIWPEPPADAVELTEEQWREFIANPSRRQWQNGEVVDYNPPPIVIVPSNISDRQFFQQLALDGEITEEEALAAVATGTVPQALATAILGLPDAYQFAANMFLQGATTFERNHVMTLTLAALMGWDSPMLDALWTNAAAL